MGLNPSLDAVKQTSNDVSPFEGFSKLNAELRFKKVADFCGLSAKDRDILHGHMSLSFQQADRLVENVIGLYSLPLGVATNFFVDGRDVLVPMVVEETSVIAAASSAAKWIRKNGGFQTKALGRLVIGQIQFPKVENPEKLVRLIDEYQGILLNHANGLVPNLVARGGGVTGFQIRTLLRPDGYSMMVLHVLCDPCDAMGANLLNHICEGLKPMLQDLTGEQVGICILSNLVDTKIFEARCIIRDVDPALGQAIEEATLFAQLDPYRSATHIKGIMNGIDPILIATGNDWRAVEAGVHTYASLGKPGSSQRSISNWVYRDGALHGRISLPLALGTVGGVTKIHPTAGLALKMMGVERAEDLARICAAAGLAQNLAALRALVSEGILKGHMRLHAANFALLAGASESELPVLEEALRKEKSITLSKAQELLLNLRHSTSGSVTHSSVSCHAKPIHSLSG